jgi:hypothetical protein
MSWVSISNNKDKLGGIIMKFKQEKIKLSKKDKLTLVKYLNVCTDLHGEGCGLTASKKNNKN